MKNESKLTVTYALVVALVSAGFTPRTCHSKQNNSGKAS